MNLFQPDLLDTDLTALAAHLHRHGWQTRKQLCAVLNWPDRKVREVAEQMGAAIVRAQCGFKLTADLAESDFAIARHAAHAALSQAAKMRAYGESLLETVSTRRETAPSGPRVCQSPSAPPESP